MEPIRVLIVDDEPNAREVLCRKVAWYRHSMSVVGSATNGVEAVEFVRDNAVDVVFMDMKMPFMDGNRAIEEIKGLGKHPAFVVLSAYSDYPYVRQSFRLGVVDYLLKNHINTPTMDALLAKISREVSALETDLRDKHGAGTHEPKDRVGDGLIVAANAPQRFRPRLEQLIDAVDIPEGSRGGVFDDGDYTVIALPDVGCLADAEAALPPDFLAKLGAIASVGVAVAKDGSRRAVTAAERACRHAYYQVGGLVVHAPGHTEEAGRVDADAHKVQLHRSVKQIDLPAARASFQGLFDEVATARPARRAAVAIVTDVYSFYLDQLYAMDAIPSQLTFGVAEIERELLGYPRFKYVRDYVTVNLANVDRFFRTSLSNDLALVLEAYIDAHVGDDLSLDALSRVFGKSSGYLSVAFSKRHSVSLHKYVNQKRIARAESYLANFNLRVKDVAELVGFKSAEHFSRTFRRHTGMAPSDYRHDP
jgi:two-component system response regulator YesN